MSRRAELGALIIEWRDRKPDEVGPYKLVDHILALIFADPPDAEMVERVAHEMWITDGNEEPAANPRSPWQNWSDCWAASKDDYLVYARAAWTAARKWWMG